jgi:hypothetical protein
MGFALSEWIKTVCTRIVPVWRHQKLRGQRAGFGFDASAEGLDPVVMVWKGRGNREYPQGESTDRRVYLVERKLDQALDDQNVGVGSCLVVIGSSRRVRAARDHG